MNIEGYIEKIIYRNEENGYTVLSVMTKEDLDDSHILVGYVEGAEAGLYISAEGEEIKNLYKLMDGRIEAIEFIAQGNKDYIEVPIKDLKFKKDILIAAISRKRKIIFPTGDDTIQEKDSVIVVTKGKAIRSLEDIFV